MEEVLDTVSVKTRGKQGGPLTPSVSAHRGMPRTLAHHVNEFAQGVQLMSDPDSKAELGTLVKDLVTAIHEEGQKQGMLKIHPLVYANLVFIAGLIFSSGVLYQRINELERRQYQMQGMEGMAPKVEAMGQEVTRLRDRLDRFFDSQKKQ